jgi:fucose 4-O-acetylase-like acetyltransferase
MRERLYELDRAKGLGIFLVVLGHIVARQYPAGVEWYPALKTQIYLFHMPFFMFVSGAIAGHAWKPIESAASYFLFIKSRAQRLLPAYFLFAFIVFLGKLGAQRTGSHVDNPIESAWRFFDVIVSPIQSFSGFLWFVYVLFLLYAALPLCALLGKKSKIGILAFAAIFQFFPVTHYLGLAQFKEYLFIFLLGFFAMAKNEAGGAMYSRIILHTKAWWPAWLAVFCVGLVVTHNSVLGDVFQFGEHESFRPYKILFGLLSIPALMGLVQSPLLGSSNLLLTFGTYTFAIYLMNTMAIGAVKAILLRFVPWDGANFYGYAPVLLLAGLFLPILAKKLIFKRIPYLDRITN